MSMEVHVFLSNNLIPDQNIWQKAIEDSGFDTLLNYSFDLNHHTGFLPARYKSEDSGFEFYLEQARDILETYPTILSQVGNRDRCASFRWSGDLTEMCAAVTSASALARLADGVYYDPQDDKVYAGVEAVEIAKEIVNVI